MSFFSKKKRSYYKGFLAEYLAVLVFFLKGYKLQKSRYKTYFGEIDLIFRKKDLVVFVEVKYRSEKEAFLDVIQEKQKLRIIKASQFYFKKFPKLQDFEIRYDVFFVSKFFLFQHHRHCFVEIL